MTSFTSPHAHGIRFNPDCVTASTPCEPIPPQISVSTPSDFKYGVNSWWEYPPLSITLALNQHLYGMNLYNNLL